MDYINPMAMLPQSEDLNSGNPMVIAQALARTRAAQPFIDQAHQSQSLGLQEKQAKFQEFQSPEAVAARMSKYGRETAENQAAMTMAPQKLAFELEEMKYKLKAMPSMTDAKIAEAEAAAMKAKGTPMEKFIKDIGSLAGALEKAPAASRPMLYQRALQVWQQQHPGAQLPQALRQYDPSVLGMYRYAQLYSTEHEQRREIERIKGEETRKNTELKNKGDLEQARISAGGAIESARIRSAAEKPVNIPQRIVQLRREIATNPQNQEAQQELNFYMQKELREALEKDTQLKLLGVQAATGNQQARVRYEERVQEIEKDFYTRQGSTPSKSPSNTKQVKVINPQGQEGMIPENQLEAALRQGFKKAP